MQYAKLGWRVFPCAPRGKEPQGSLVPHGVKDATTDENQIRKWWTKQPDANIAVACGNGIHVVDVDVDVDAGENGWDTLSQLAQEGKIPPETVRQNTPRGGGAHFFYCSDRPPANKNSFLPGIDIRSEGYYVVLAPSIHPNGGQYEWAPKLSPWDCKLVEFPDFMRPPDKPTPTLQGISIQYTPYLDSPPTSEILVRASAYLATCDPAIQGQGGHDKLLWAAVCLVHGFLLSDSQAYDLLVREYNPRCDPPWDLSDRKDLKDFRRKITEARKLVPKHRAGWLLNDEPSIGADTPILNIEKLVKKARRKRAFLLPACPMPAETVDSNSELEFLVRPTGLVGDICGWINGTAMKVQPFLTLGCVLAFCGTLFGRKVKDYLGTRTNLYCMGIANSSAGKDHAMVQVRRLALWAGCLELLGGDDFASDAGIESRLEKSPATLFLCDEIGHLLQTLKSNVTPHTAKIVSLLMKLYSATKSVYSGREYADIEKRRMLVQPCCCVYGMSYPEKFFSALSPEELRSGWLSRCLVFHSKVNPPKDYEAYNEEMPKEIVEKVGAWFVRKIEQENEKPPLGFRDTGYTLVQIPIQLLVPAKDEADRIFRDFDIRANKVSEEEPELACLWGKAEENARRIGLIVACGESFDKPVITSSIADYACRLVHYLLIDFSAKVSMIVENETEGRKRKLLMMIEKTGITGCTKSELAKKSQWLSQWERKAMIEDLVEAELIIKEIVATKTKKFSAYWTVENYLAYRKRKETKHVPNFT